MQEILNDQIEKIIEIETKLAFQEETIEQLNEVIIGQQNTLDKLQRQLQQLNSKIVQESQHWNQDAGMVDEKPPHY